MVRTHPVTGWKALFAGGLFSGQVEGVTETESRELLTKVTRLISDNHDLQCRFRWEGSGDMGEFHREPHLQEIDMTNLVFQSYLGQSLCNALPDPGSLWKRGSLGMARFICGGSAVPRPCK